MVSARHAAAAVAATVAAGSGCAFAASVMTRTMPAHAAHAERAQRVEDETAAGVSAAIAGAARRGELVEIRQSDPHWQARALAALRDGPGFCVIRDAIPPNVLRRVQHETAPLHFESDVDAGAAAGALTQSGSRGAKPTGGAFSHCYKLIQGLRKASVIDVASGKAVTSRAALKKTWKHQLEGTQPGRWCGVFRQGSAGRFHFMPGPKTDLFKLLSDDSSTSDDEHPQTKERKLPSRGWQWWLPVVHEFVLTSNAAKAVGATSHKDMYLSEAQLVVALPGEGSDPQPWHADNALGGLTVIAPLVPMFEAIGPTQLLPNSLDLSAKLNFRVMFLLDPLITAAVRLTAWWAATFSSEPRHHSMFWATEPLVSPGDAILMDARMLHRGLANQSHKSTPQPAANTSVVSGQTGREELTANAFSVSDGIIRPILVLRYDLSLARAPGR